ncbi:MULTISPECIES: hypothetical protein [unclassified Pseudomonas]|uniref:hypothetical protein n=1 Tax=unclassified Pseudomonas TaxID=196821 RepID=UPI001587576C|nr:MULTISPECIES: hypothetical protein [unclassified Pseudomonas]
MLLAEVTQRQKLAAAATSIWQAAIKATTPANPRDADFICRILKNQGARSVAAPGKEINAPTARCR